MKRFLFLIFAIGLIAYNGIPVSKATMLGEMCENSAQCQEDRPGRLSHCQLQLVLPMLLCQCNRGSHNDTGICKTGKKLGAVCLTDGQCWEMGGLSECSGFKCGCREGSIPKVDGSGCVPSKKLGEQCEVKWECPDAEFEYSDCLNGICQCVGERFNNSEGTRCLRETDLWGRCNENIECKLGSGRELSECVGPQQYNKNCKCSEGSVDVEGYCGKLAEKLGDRCEGDKQCRNLRDLVDCKENSCSCREGRVPNEDGTGCKATKKIGEQCNVKWECPDVEYGTGWSDCIDDVCQCVDRFLPNPEGTRCMSAKDLGWYCEEDLECERGEGGELSECVPGYENYDSCQCKPGSVRNATWPPMTCVPEAFKINL